ncbi:Gfo/Idh/MocA family protein [Paenibacillus thalictri]|uniref:Gfo/Idh/MocA family oxidoreductase n=1 Tax=Paenibacillus thalictri TaxID=2527873 RepID=A0A4Q9DTL6_9BACL|nr:Gfo/Idh/MocA family oxidoreductase [Paenibacillus thalictri]TBL78537.1 Gfo/Idh/MocA family oxidoreductase [Paenibacillus thalictri]
MKVCLIGCGRQSQTAHGPALQRYRNGRPDLRLAACCDLDKQLAEQFRYQFGFERAYGHMDDMLNAEKPDAVIVSVTEKRSASVAANILERRIPLLLEKPPGMTLQEARALAGIAAQGGGVPHRVAFNRRYMPLTRKLRECSAELLDTQRIYAIEYEMVRVRRTDPDFSTTAIHAIDTARYLACSAYKQVRFHYRELPHLGDGAADMTLTGSFANGIFFRVGLHPVSGVNVEKVILRGEERSFELTYPVWGPPFVGGRLEYTEAGKPYVWEEAGKEEPLSAFGYEEQLCGFLEALRSGRGADSNDLRSTLQSVDLMECLRNRRTSWQCAQQQE